MIEKEEESRYRNATKLQTEINTKMQVLPQAVYTNTSHLISMSPCQIFSTMPALIYIIEQTVVQHVIYHYYQSHTSLA